MASLAVAAILIFEATNKTSIPCGTSDFNETLASLIFMLVMKNIQKWGLRGIKWALHDKKNPLFLPKNFEIQNLLLTHLPIQLPGKFIERTVLKSLIARSFTSDISLDIEFVKIFLS